MQAMGRGARLKSGYLLRQSAALGWQGNPVESPLFKALVLGVVVRANPVMGAKVPKGRKSGTNRRFLGSMHPGLIGVCI